jgi:hypothetical protein
MITKNDASSAAHMFYTSMAIGGTFYDASVGISSTINGKLYYGGLAEPYSMNFNGGKEQIQSLSSIGFDFGHFEWLAMNLKSGTYGSKKVFVLTSGTTGSSGGCYTTYDFIPGGQPNTGADVLVVFNTDDEICLTKTSDGRQFGPSILAPFSHVELLGEAGYIDGSVIAKSFSTCGSNPSNLQMHGKMYSGTIECPPAGSVVAPTPSPVSVSSGSVGGTCTCSNSNSPVAYSWKCGTDLYYCASKISSICSNSLSSNPSLVSLNDAQCTQMNELKLGDKCLVTGTVTQAKGLSHKVCYTSLNPLTGAKYDGSCEMCSGYTAVPGLPAAAAPGPTPSPTKSPTSVPTKSPTSGPTTNPTPGPTKSPTNSPTPGPTTKEPSPTKSPTAVPTPSPVSASSGSAGNTCTCNNSNSPVAYSWKCGTDLYYCASKITSICSNSLSSGPTLVPLNDAQCTQMNALKLGETCLVTGPVTQAKALSHKVCYTSLTPLTGAKFDGSCEMCSGYTAVPGLPAAATPVPTPSPTKSPTPSPTTAAGSGSGSGCCSSDYRNCMASAWCSESQSNCLNNCSGMWLSGGARNNCIAKDGECTTNTGGCCSPGTCKGNAHYRQCQ